MQKFSLILLLFVMVTSSVFAKKYTDVKDVAALKAKMIANSKKLQTIKSDFVQVKHIDFLESEITSNGKFFFKKDNKLKWQYTSPYNYVVTINNGKVTIEDDGKKSTFDAKSSKNFQELNDLLVGSVTGDIFSSGKFRIRYLQSDKHYVLLLFPKTASLKKNLKKMELFISKKNMSIDVVNMVEPSDDYTLITFKNKKLNATISDNIFSGR